MIIRISNWPNSVTSHERARLFPRRVIKRRTRHDAVVWRRDIAEVAGADVGQRDPARPLWVNDAAHLLIVRLVLRFAVVDGG